VATSFIRDPEEAAMKTAALVALALIPTATLAAGPFQVRRATSGQSVRTAAPVATIATSPYDGELSAMVDPASYYYAVYDASGTALRISVQRNPVTQTIRIGFDDGLAASAPVSATSSSISVAPASIRADGLQAAVITVVPRDANGVMLGTGLSMSFDAALLWPAHLSGPVSDLGDGSYRATAVGSVPGTGTVSVLVEGAGLATSPQITVTPLNPSGSLRDLAIEQLAGMIGPGGPLAGLAGSAGSGTPQAATLASVLAAANDALATLANDDESRDDNVLKGDFDVMVSQLAGLLANPGALNPLDVRDAMDDLLDVGRLIVRWNIERATGACGVCDGSGHPARLCDAIATMEHADVMRTAISPDWGGIADEYSRAIEWALQAFHSCS
jgi:hypothetical protein